MPSGPGDDPHYYPYHQDPTPGMDYPLANMLVFVVAFMLIVIVLGCLAYMDAWDGGRRWWGWGRVEECVVDEPVYMPVGHSNVKRGVLVSPPYNPDSAHYGGHPIAHTHHDPHSQQHHPARATAPPENFQMVAKIVNPSFGAALRPPWSRGAAVRDGDVHAAMMSSASVGAFFKAN